MEMNQRSRIAEGSLRKVIRSVIAICVTLFVGGSLSAAELRFDVRHERALRDHLGVLTIDETGISYQQALTEKQKKKPPKKPPELENVRFEYQDIQELWLSPDKLVLVTYEDRPRLLGIDKEYEFFVMGERSFDEAYLMLKNRLDQRFVAALADPQASVLWEIPVKLQGTLKGSEGVLQVGPEHIVYKTDQKEASRTWRYQDLENISTSGPYQLTLTTYERAKTHYGSLKGFNFQLKQRLDEKQFDILWKRLNREKGLRFLTSQQETSVLREQEQ
jgi:hypothetical protein